MTPEITVDAAGVVLAARIAFRAKRVLKVNGGSGVGKSEISRQIADVLRQEYEAQGEEFFFALFNVQAALQPDVIGFLLPYERKHTSFDGKETFTLREGAYTYPYFLRDEETGEPAIKYKYGLIVIDEWDKATPDLKRVLTSMVWEHRLGEHRFSKDFNIMILANRAKDRSGSTKEFDYSINRWDEVNYQPSLDGFNKWVRDQKKNIHPDVLEWVNNGENADIFSGEPPEKQGSWATSRSVETMSELLYAIESFGLDVSNHVAYASLAGAVGPGKAAQFQDHKKMAAMLPSYEDVVHDPKRAKLPPDERVDANMVIIHRLAHKLDVRDAEKVITYVRRLPQAYGVPFIKLLMQRDRNLFLNEHVGKWSQENGDVLAAINQLKVK